MFLAKNNPIGGQNIPFWAEMGVCNSVFFSKPKLPENAPKRFFLGRIKGGKKLLLTVHELDF